MDYFSIFFQTDFHEKDELYEDELQEISSLRAKGNKEKKVFCEITKKYKPNYEICFILSKLVFVHKQTSMGLPFVKDIIANCILFKKDSKLKIKMKKRDLLHFPGLKFTAELCLLIVLCSMKWPPFCTTLELYIHF